MPTASYGITCRARNRFTSPDGRPTIGRSRAEGLAERRGDADRALITERRGTHHRLGFALRLTTARFIGRFLTDPLDVPDEVLQYLADQLEIDDVAQAKRYTERRAAERAAYP
ncbi:DUF4158 domain-containing protein [Nonomuraea dietziae]|uniref:DUF4158 domain-containing protein n=1 Tax=Nonomuraea dietziae TaxID=65515 RepID=UPI003F4CDD7A